MLVVLTHQETLQRLADETGGYYFRARASEDMSKIYKLLDDLEPVEQEQQQMRPLSALFHWPLGLALLISLLTLLMKSISTGRFFTSKKVTTGVKH